MTQKRGKRGLDTPQSETEALNQRNLSQAMRKRKSTEPLPAHIVSGIRRVRTSGKTRTEVLKTSNGWHVKHSEPGLFWMIWVPNTDNFPASASPEKAFCALVEFAKIERSAS